MNDKGEIIYLTDEDRQKLNMADLVALTDEEAAVLNKLSQEDRATLYPLMSRRDRRKAERAAKKNRGH